MSTKKALVLSGGAVKGSFQAGAIKAVIESGFYPDIIYGISVGSLNGAFLSNGAAKANGGKPPTPEQWKAIAGDLVDFWLNNIRKPADVAIQRSIFHDVIHALFNDFDGLSDTTPIDEDIDRLFDPKILASSPAQLVVGTVDFVTGSLLYKKPVDNDFLAYVKGSIAIPIAMPPSISVTGEVLFDGGVRDVAPLGHAINEGASEVVGIICQAEKLTKTDGNFSEKHIMQVITRLEDIIVNQNVQNDDEWITFINKVTAELQMKKITLDTFKDYNIIKHILIRPEKDLTLDISKFTAQDISNAITLGYDTAKKKMSQGLTA